jgi:hypothetical protein
MPEIVTTPMSYFEVLIEYERPNLKLWLDRAAVVQALFDAFARWNVGVDDVDILTTGKNSEQGIKFRLTEKRVSFFFSPAACRFTRDNTSWETAPETIEILDTALQTLVAKGEIKPAMFKTVVALHVQPKSTPFIEIIKKVIPASMAALDDTPASTAASVLKWDKRKVTIDGSGQIANGIFIRYEREFKATASYEEMAYQLKADEDKIFAMLDVKEET